jgi:hypothetical protein
MTTPNATSDKVVWWPVDKLVKLVDVDTIQSQIDIRLRLMDQMVGTLYPSIISGEVARLRDRIAALRRGEG